MFSSAPPAKEIERINDGLSTIREFLELAKNPAPLHALHETARQEAALTEEQQEKHAEAVEFMELYDKLKADLDTQKAVLLSDQNLHTDTVTADQKAAKTVKDLLDKQNEDQKTVTRTQKAEAKRLADLEKQLLKQYSDLVSPLDERATQLEKDEKAAAKEKKRLQRWADKLQKQADIIAGAGSSAAPTEEDETDEAD